MKLLRLSNSDYITLLDDEDFNWLTSLKIPVYLDESGYAYARFRKCEYHGVHRIHKIIQHRHGLLIVGCETDHIDGKKLNNQKVNLRQVSSQEHSYNKGLTKQNRSGFKGVHAHCGKFQAAINADGKKHYIGFFASPIEAAKAYDKKARELQGRFARLNFPELV